MNSVQNAVPRERPLRTVFQLNGLRRNDFVQGCQCHATFLKRLKVTTKRSMMKGKAFNRATWIFRDCQDCRRELLLHVTIAVSRKYLPVTIPKTWVRERDDK